MKLDQMNFHISDWMANEGPRSDMVVSNRIRLARNFQDYNFQSTLSDDKRQEIWEKFKNYHTEHHEVIKSYIFKIGDLSEIEQKFLLERHLISQDILRRNKGSGVIISADETISIMVNEEDHLRLQIILSGFQLSKAWLKLSRIDDRICSFFDMAFHANLGYLTACPTNLGTGLRASLLMHLPGLVLTKQIKRVFNGLGHLGLTVRGLYGEGSDIQGNLFQISNQVTLGHTETELIENLEQIADQILESEVRARDVLMQEARHQIEDKIWRAYGTLSHARILTSEEVINLSSGIRLGIAMGIITNITFKELNELMLVSQPAHLQKRYGGILDPTERDILRAQMVREKINRAKIESSGLER